MSNITGSVMLMLARARDAALRAIRVFLTRAADWLREKLGSPARLIRSFVTAVIGKDRGFGFWWLVVTAAIGLAIGLLVAALLSPVIGIIAAIVVAIGMLVRRSRSREPQTAAA
jgi:hypothetical protein